MLKFLYDEKKKQNFLKFWKIKNLEDFKALAEDVIFFASQYARLDATAKAFMARVIAKHIENSSENRRDSKTKTPQKDGQKDITSPFYKRLSDPAADTASPKYTVADLFEKTDPPSTHEPLLNHLHDIDFINWLKNRSVLLETRDTVEITDALSSFLEKILFLTHNKQVLAFFTEHANALLPKNTAAFTSSELKILKKLAHHYAYPMTAALKTKDMLELIKKAFHSHLAVLGIFHKTGDLYVILNPILSALPSSAAKPAAPSTLPSLTAFKQPITVRPDLLAPDELFLTKRKITQKLFTITALLYEKKTREPALTKDIPIKSSNELKYLTTIAKQFLTQNYWKLFLKKSSYVKIRIILKIGHPHSYAFLKELLDLVSFKDLPNKLEKTSQASPQTSPLEIDKTHLTESPAKKLTSTSTPSEALTPDSTSSPTHQTITLTEKLLLSHINQKRFWEQKPYLSATEFSSRINPLLDWRLITARQGSFKLDMTLATQIIHTPTQTPLVEVSQHDNLIIDSDMSIVVFNETISLAAMHILSLFTKITFADHTTQCIPKLEFSHLSWFAGLDEANTTAVLKKLSPDHYTRQVAEYFHLYFEHIALTRVNRAILLKTSSRQVFLKMKYALEKLPEFKDTVLFLEKESHLIFYKKQSYLKARKILAKITSII